jgi:hypothetical protein
MCYHRNRYLKLLPNSFNHPPSGPPDVTLNFRGAFILQCMDTTVFAKHIKNRETTAEKNFRRNE